MASPSENCPTIKVLPSFARATIAPHWQMAYTTFPARIQAKFKRNERPGITGSLPLSVGGSAEVEGVSVRSVAGDAPFDSTGGNRSLCVTLSPVGNGRKRMY